MVILEGLNDKQLEAVCHYEGPMLILAGAGSGKTRVLTHRIAWLIQEKGVNPWNIMAITFTNKAASEMKERVDRLLKEDIGGVWVSTFHSTCSRFLRRYIDRIGYQTNFSIYDTEDQKALVRDILRELGLDPKKYKEKTYLSAISRAKDDLKTPEELKAEAVDSYRENEKLTAEIYERYQKLLQKNNALDFDDLLLKTVELFQKCPEVLDGYQERFRYIMIDEYQDTNHAQFEFVRLLAAKYRNLCVVGDDDQSIYRFRGANIQNILNFEQYFSNAKVVRLEQNYRSTQNILDAANGVICHNQGRKEKTLWTAGEKGEPLVQRELSSAAEEAEYVLGDILREKEEQNGHYNDFAILYRTNAQSRIFEEKLIRAGIPYKIIGGVNFYARKEIKDILAYLKTIDNGLDDVAVRRIINVPRRGIGAATISRIQDYASAAGISFYEAMKQARQIPGTSRALLKLEGFTGLIQSLRSAEEFYSVETLIKEVLEKTEYQKELEAEDTDESRERICNLQELVSKAVSYEETAEEPSLSGFLQEVALVADIDALEEEADYLVLLTLHSAKGLEFPYVYMVGMEEGLFPGEMSINSYDSDDIEEERRLCYVGITRARKKITFTSAASRMLYGEPKYHVPSRFLTEIPTGLFYQESRRGSVRGRTLQDQMGRSRNPSSEPSRSIRKTIVTPPSYSVKQYEVKTGQKPDYEVGDTVKHQKFGTGIVKAIVMGGRDYEVTVDFTQCGVKKMFASFAKLQKL